MGQIQQKPQLIAVDTNVLLDLADESETATDCIDTIRERIPNSIFIIPPTVVQELVFISSNGQTQERKNLALKALQSILKWGFTPTNCVPVGHGITEQIAKKLAAQGLLPDEEENDCLIVAEAALADSSILLSSDRHITSIDRTQLQLLLKECHVSTPIIASPFGIVNRFFQKK